MTKTLVALAAAMTSALIVTACWSARSGPGVPSIGVGATHAHGGYSTTRVGQLHAAAQCIRSHGVPTYQDPVLTADGQVYTDARSIQDLGAKSSRAQQDAMFAAIRQACGALLTAAGFQPDDEAPAPPALVQAGVRSAQCLRANGLPNMRDPSSSTGFTPGHGFGLTADELPNNGALGKQDPAVQRAFTACRALLDAEIRASDLSALAHG